MHTAVLARFKVAACFFGLSILLFCQPARGTDYYVARGGQEPSPTGNYTSWATAASNIADAVAVALAAGDTVWVSNGTYTVDAEILLDVGVTVRSFNNGELDRDGTIVRGNHPLSTNRCFQLTHADAVVDGFTITNGCTDSDAGGGVRITAGTLRNCLVAYNTATNGQSAGGVYLNGSSSMITNCDVIANATYGGGSGGGLFMSGGADAWNCRILQNWTPNYASQGSGIYASGAQIYNCEISGNSVVNPDGDNGWGGGVWFASASGNLLRNCLVTENVGSRWGTTDLAAVSSAAGGDPTIENCTIVNNEGYGIGSRYKANYTVRNTIVYFNSGATAWTCGGGTLVASNCCVTTTNNMTAGSSGNITDVPSFTDYDGDDFSLLPWSVGVDQGVTQSWMSTSLALGGNARLSANGRVDIGAYETTAGPPPTVHVAHGGQTPSHPYTSWDTAASNLHSAADGIYAGSTILVSNGVYTLTNEIVVGVLTIRSYNNGAVDRKGTIINGNYPNTTNRCFRLTLGSSILEGLTITNGFVEGHGGGVHMVAGTVKDCLIAGNTATSGSGGGIYAEGPGCLVTDCDIVGNLSDGGHGGGLYLTGGPEVRNCAVLQNRAPVYPARGGGIYASPAEIYNCTIISNSLDNPSALDGWGGSGVCFAGGIGLLRNCLVADNVGGAWGDCWAGVGHFSGAQSMIENCTIVGNEGVGLGGRGAATYHVRNSIVYFNTYADAWNCGGGTLVASNCCVTTTNNMTAGSGNIEEDPQFVAFATGNYRLTSRSPCVNGGIALSWMDAALDLDGNARKSGPVDIGCYEYRAYGTLLMIQ